METDSSAHPSKMESTQSPQHQCATKVSSSAASAIVIQQNLQESDESKIMLASETSVSYASVEVSISKFILKTMKNDRMLDEWNWVTIFKYLFNSRNFGFYFGRRKIFLLCRKPLSKTEVRRNISIKIIIKQNP